MGLTAGQKFKRGNAGCLQHLVSAKWYEFSVRCGVIADRTLGWETWKNHSLPIPWSGPARGLALISVGSTSLVGAAAGLAGWWLTDVMGKNGKEKPGGCPGWLKLPSGFPVFGNFMTPVCGNFILSVLSIACAGRVCLMSREGRPPATCRLHVQSTRL